MTENIDPGFQMDTAYYQRSGISTIKFYIQTSIRPQRQKASLAARRDAISYTAPYIHDKVTGMDDKELMFEAYASFILKGQVGGYRLPGAGVLGRPSLPALSPAS